MPTYLRPLISPPLPSPSLPVAGSAGQVITGNHETYLISADSAESADSWVAAIRRVMHEVSSHSSTYKEVFKSFIHFSAVWWRYVWAELGGDDPG